MSVVECCVSRTALAGLVCVPCRRRPHDGKTCVWVGDVTVCGHHTVLWTVFVTLIENIVMQSVLCDSPGTLCFLTTKLLMKFQWGHLHWVLCWWGRQNWWFLTTVSLYLTNGARYGHSYCGILVGSYMWSFKLYYFQWPWVTPELLSTAPFCQFLGCFFYLWNEWS